MYFFLLRLIFTVTYGLQAIEHFLEKNDGQTEHSKLEYKRVVADKEVEYVIIRIWMKLLRIHFSGAIQMV